MKKQSTRIAVLSALVLALSGFGAWAAPHDCAAHCAGHVDKEAGVCVDHCKNGAAGHNCGTHCAAQPVDGDSACATHCAGGDKK